MTVIKTVELQCDRCGKKEVCDFEEFWTRTHGRYSNGYFAINEEIHLCQDCADIYLEDRKQRQKQLIEFFNGKDLIEEEAHGKR